MYLHFKMQKEIRSYFEGAGSLGQLIRVGKLLSVLESIELESLLTQVRSSLGEEKQFSKIVRSVGVESTDPLRSTFQEYYTIFLLAEVRGFYSALDFIKNNREALQALFLAVGEMDTCQWKTPIIP